MQRSNLLLLVPLLLCGALVVGSAEAEQDNSALQAIRAHADGSISLTFNYDFDTVCPVKNSVRISATEPGRSMIDLIYAAYERNHKIQVHLASGCTQWGQPVAESIEVPVVMKTGRVMRLNL